MFVLLEYFPDFLFKVLAFRCLLLHRWDIAVLGFFSVVFEIMIFFKGDDLEIVM